MRFHLAKGGVFVGALFCEEETEVFLVVWWGGGIGLGNCGVVLCWLGMCKGEEVRVIMGWVVACVLFGMGRVGLSVDLLEFLGSAGIVLCKVVLGVKSDGGAGVGCFCVSLMLLEFWGGEGVSDGLGVEIVVCGGVHCREIFFVSISFSWTSLTGKSNLRISWSISSICFSSVTILTVECAKSGID